MKSANLIKEVEIKECPDAKHVFSIVHGVGQYFGMPIWICVKCNKKVFAT